MRAGGIGTYALHISHLLADHGETVHVIGQQCREAPIEREVKCDGKLTIHRIPFEDWKAGSGFPPHPNLGSEQARGLFSSEFHRQCFSWQVALLTERLIEQEGIDIIEAEEYEAPLYYFLLRRALGLGPKHHPPCIVHLHSSTEFVTKHNGKDLWRPYILTARRLEDYCVGAADALLCPSHYLAAQVKARHGLSNPRVKVIPYPLGDMPLVPRNQAVWKNGSICYVGRLEPRKGVIDLIDAAVLVAHEYPTAKFEFVGRNMLGTREQNGEEIIARRIPKQLKKQFHFFGEKKRSDMLTFLGQARIAVIPSRWDNLPYTCLEAMGSGLPVITTCQGGMAEVLVDGESGWLMNDPGSEGLAHALRRALQTPPPKLCEMGKKAAATIRNTCGNQAILEVHLEFCKQIVSDKVSRSSQLPLNLPDSKRSLSDKNRGPLAQNGKDEDVAVVIVANNCRNDLCESLVSLERQTRKPKTVLIVVDRDVGELPIEALASYQGSPWKMLDKRNLEPAIAKNAAIDWILGQPDTPLGITFLHAGDVLDDECLSVCELILQRCKNIGIVSGWTRQIGDYPKLRIRPCPAFPYQWVLNDVAPLSILRVAALREAGHFRQELGRGYAEWDLANAVLAAGWIGVNAPIILGTEAINTGLRTANTQLPTRMHEEILARFPDLVSRDAEELALITSSHLASILDNAVTDGKSTIFSRLRGKGLGGHVSQQIFGLVEKLKSFF